MKTPSFSRHTKHIDTASILKSSSGLFVKRLPDFVFKPVSWLICERQINEVISRHIEHIGVGFQPRVIEDLNLKIQVCGHDHMPDNPRCFFAANHPFGVIDGLLITYFVGQKYGDLRAIGNDAFLYIPNLKPLIAAVNVYGRSSRVYLAELEKVYQSDIPITHFPAGEVSRIYEGKIQDTLWQKSFITKAISAQRDVVPIYFGGTNSALFYTVYRSRKALGIKTNFELALLPREALKKRNATIEVVIGKPIPWQTFDRSHTPHEWAQKVRAHVYRLHENPEVEFSTRMPLEAEPVPH